jgi:LCP family protein required for cell wall assembly
MSDGDNATPGHHGVSDADGDNPWLTRSRRPSTGAAPWERRSNLRPPITKAAGEPAGNHTDSGTVTVADLIAKVGDEPRARRAKSHAKPDRPTSHAKPERPTSHAKPERPTSHAIEPELPPYREPHRERAHDLAGAVTVTIPRVRAADIPDLEATRKLRAIRVPPRRHGDVDAEPDPKRKRRALMIAGRGAAALFAVVALSMTGGAYQWTASKNHRLNHIAALDPNSKDIVDPTAQFGDENFLIAGVDSRAGVNADMGAGNTQDAAGVRSDTVMLVNIPASRKRVVVVSFPRDLAITPMLCNSWDNDTATYGSDKIYTETKLNSAYAFGGPKCLVKVIQKISGLNINRFMAIDFAGFATMVDALGGVDVCSSTPLQDAEVGTVLEHAGHQKIDGQTALKYVRARMITTEIASDYSRIKRQQMFLSSLLRSLISREVFFNLGKLNSVVDMFINDSYVDNIRTKDMVDLGQSLQNVAAGRMSFITVPTTGETDADGNEPPRTDDIHALFTAIIKDNPLPGENNNNETTTPTTAALSPQANTTEPSQPARPNDTADLVDAVTTSPHDVTVHVSNSTGQNGLAATAANELEQHGFNVLSPDDYPSSLKSTTVFFSPGNEQAAATVASSFANPQIERVTGMGDVVQVVLGSDFHTVSPPPPSGSAVHVHVSQGVTSTPTRLPQDLSITNGADTSCE